MTNSEANMNVPKATVPLQATQFKIKFFVKQLLILFTTWLNIFKIYCSLKVVL